MADIRVTGVLDPTDSRAVPENPLSYGGRWVVYRSDHSATDALALYANGGGHHVITCSSQATADPQQAHYRWTPQTFDGDMEIWGYFSSYLGWNDGASLSIGFTDKSSGVNGSWNGWHMRYINTFAYGRWELWKITGGSGSLLATENSGDPSTAGTLCMFRRNGDDLELWISPDDGANWTNYLSYTDSAYQTNMYLSVGSSVSNITDYPGLYHIGGGVKTNRPQFYRWIKN